MTDPRGVCLIIDCVGTEGGERETHTHTHTHHHYQSSVSHDPSEITLI